jgi:glycosyltransferase involved in cell wall biosynthesis
VFSRVRERQVFYFLEAKRYVFPMGFRAHTVPELAAEVERFGVDSVIYHFIEARFADPQWGNDFSRWLRLCGEDDKAAESVVMQKSQREGFGLVVTEAMWKDRAVVGGDTGGISYQIIDGVTGYLAHTIEGGTYRLRQILSNPPLARLMGQESRHRVQSVFLLPHYLRNWLGVLLSFKYPGSGATMLVD